MMVIVNIPLPPDLARLVRHYKDKNQAAVRFRVPSWQRALASCSGNVTAFLTDDRYTTPPSRIASPLGSTGLGAVTPAVARVLQWRHPSGASS
jgi:hypothetical protein